ncbi:hypothetical protein PR048_003699 [Dryococelus australis]|uniref:Uncharacterized protein n=1 Tax=Dryococelus australis TaxID=614101 RepID=A0ABQ9INW1_9NEOP|nr:hypothetical protein PR048_003699 [Dryococelus australis]
MEIISLLVHHHRKPGLLPGFLHVGIVPDDDVGYPVSPTISFRRCSMLTSIAPVGSQDLDVKSRPNIFTPHSPYLSVLITNNVRVRPMRVTEVSTKQRRNDGARGNGKSPRKPADSGIVRHDSHLRKSGVSRLGIDPSSPWWELRVICTCASEVKKLGNDTGDTNTARLVPYRSYAQGVQCFRPNAVLWTYASEVGSGVSGRTYYAYKERKSCEGTCIAAQRDWAAKASDWGHDYLPNNTYI